MKKLEAVKKRAEGHWVHMCEICQNDVDAPKDRAYLLKLVEYARHQKDCTYTEGSYENDPSCTCGLTSLLETEE